MGRAFVWTAQQQQAFELLMTGRYTQGWVAERVGVSRRTVQGWARRPAWRTRQEQWQQERLAARDEAWRRRVRQSYGLPDRSPSVGARWSSVPPEESRQAREKPMGPVEERTLFGGSITITRRAPMDNQ